MNISVWAMGTVAIVLGAAHIWSRMTSRRSLALWLKALPVALALLVTVLAGSVLPPPVASVYRTLLALGLLISMAGDIFLALPEDRFVPGLASFLVAHILYVAAFVSRSGFHLAPLALGAAVVYGAIMIALLLPGVDRKTKPAVVVYMLVILLMGWQAAGLWVEMRDTSAALALAGAVAFIISDSALAWDRFRSRFAAAPVVVMVTYYAAQWLLALSVLQR